MALITKSQLKEIRSYCKTIIKEKISQDLKYHGWNETSRNLEMLDTLASKLKLNSRDEFNIRAAIYYMHTGFINEDNRPYTASMTIAQEHLDQLEVDQSEIDQVVGCLHLLAEDKMPKSLAERVFHDIAYSYYGEKKLRKRIKLSWEEKNFLRKEKVDYLTTVEEVYNHMSKHEYLTSWAKTLFDYRKNKNVAKLKATIDKEKRKNTLSSNKTALTMFKTALRNHIDLVNIADKKAGIMISINAILMTLMIPILGSYIIDVSRFIIPSIVLIVTCGTAVILATLATRPQLSKGDVDTEGIYKGEKSLFYFGNFFKMEKPEYRKAVKDVIVRDITLENSIINDLYDMGYILGIKYKRLRWCYIIFAVGIGLTLLTFAISFFIFPEI